MNLTAIDWIIMLVYFVFVLGIGVLLKRKVKTSTDFFLAGRAIPGWVAGLAFLSANLGAQEVIGHYVATASLATGVYETINNFASLPPEHPTVFEYFRKELKRPSSDAWVIAPSNGFNRIGESSHRSFGAGLGARVILPKHLLSAALSRGSAHSARPGMGPEALRTLLARLRPRDLGVNEATDPVLARFELKLLTEGSGTQIFSTTFAQLAAREALRRAQPLTLLVRFAPRQRQRPMNELLSASRAP
ncbi:MAG TPA: hypothetical protein VE734_13610, partial [Terriglobales bacterium]|nr:hypothetical protein [Terriglobales bacterium]